MTTFASLSGPDFLKLSRQQIKALSLDELQLLVLRSQRLLATALFKPVQCLFEVMPDEFVIEIFLEWLPIEELASFDLALTNHYYRDKYLSLLQDTVHRGVLSVSRNERGYKFNSGVAEWLESRNVFMRALKFYDRELDIPAGFLTRTGSQLLKLDLTDCRKVSDAGFAELVGCCPSLEDVKLEGLAISDTGLRKLAEGCPSLEDVGLENCTNISDDGAASLATHCTGLHTLNLGSTHVTDTGLTSLGEGCRALKKIDISGLTISDTGLAKLAEGCPRLEDVDLAGGAITDDGLASLAQHCAGLHTLNLIRTHVTDAGLTSLGEGCRALKKIFLNRLKNISDTGLAKLAEDCPMLEVVNVTRCPNITDGGVASLARLRPGLKILYYDIDF